MSSEPPFRRVAIVGLGLIGGSIAFAARKAWPSVHIVGIDREAVVHEALARRAIHDAGDDVAAVAKLGPDAVLFPKIQSPDDVHAAVAALDQAGAPATLPIWIMAETPRCIMSMDSIANASPRLACIVAGTSDLSRDLRARPAPGRIGVISALSIIVIAARAYGLDALDGVHLDMNDEEGYQAACEQGRDLGFDGKTLIHPKQIAAANSAFAPNPTEIEQARAIVAAWAEARAQGKGICVLGGKLIEKLHVEDAERLLQLHEAIEAQTESGANSPSAAA